VRKALNIRSRPESCRERRCIMRIHGNEMFHDEAAHDLEKRLAILAGVAFLIGIVHWIVYHAIL
jgi:hypothetical protein